MHDTVKEFDQVTAKCRTIFNDKMADYGPSWRIFRLHGITDQLYIKVCNIRQRQQTGVSLVGDDIEGNLRAIVNYGIMAIIQDRQGFADGVDISSEKAMEWYDGVLNEAKELMVRKNHDYGEAWREMSKEGIVDMIMAKIMPMTAKVRRAARNVFSFAAVFPCASATAIVITESSVKWDIPIIT